MTGEERTRRRGTSRRGLAVTIPAAVSPVSHPLHDKREREQVPDVVNRRLAGEKPRDHRRARRAVQGLGSSPHAARIPDVESPGVSVKGRPDRLPTGSTLREDQHPTLILRELGEVRRRVVHQHLRGVVHKASSGDHGDHPFKSDFEVEALMEALRHPGGSTRLIVVPRMRGRDRRESRAGGTQKVPRFILFTGRPSHSKARPALADHRFVVECSGQGRGLTSKRETRQVHPKN